MDLILGLLGCALVFGAVAMALTADDLAKLTPEQITALFEAVGKLMAIKATIEKSP